MQICELTRTVNNGVIIKHAYNKQTLGAINRHAKKEPLGMSGSFNLLIFNSVKN